MPNYGPINTQFRILVCTFVLALIAGGVFSAGTASPTDTGRAILSEAGIEGGVVVHVGCDSGRLTAALRPHDRFLVQGLDRQMSDVRAARDHVRSRGLYGQITINHLTEEALPYIDNMINLLVIDDRGNLQMSQIMRVLRPNGVAYIKRHDGYEKIVKPRPDNIDHWTHYLHDTTNNAVAHDTAIGPPRGMQWRGEPKWARHHDHIASVSAMVEANGRVFHIHDEGSKASIRLPAHWYLTARDAFNGKVLWKKPIPHWWPRLYPFKSGPTILTRRLVAVGNTVFVTPGLDRSVAAIHAATGKTIKTYDRTQGTEEILVRDGKLFLVANTSSYFKNVDNFQQKFSVCHRARNYWHKKLGWKGEKKRLMAVDADSGKILWSKEKPVAPVTLTADGRRIYYLQNDRVVALDPASGKKLWRSQQVPVRNLIITGFAPTLVEHRGALVFFGGKNQKLVGLSAETGEILWQNKLPRSGHYSPQDVLCIDGIAWGGATAGGRSSGQFKGFDVKTGEVVRKFPPDIPNRYMCMHQRCYRSKATEKYILPSWLGIEFVNLNKQHWQIHHWVRGGCMYGIMPANGMVYTTPHSCACYMQSKLSGFSALRPTSAAPATAKKIPDAKRLQTGPAYRKVPPANCGIGTDATGEWPTYRHDGKRSGSTKTHVPAELSEAWKTKIGGRLTTLTLAGNRAFVASVHDHTLHALDADNGNELWTYVAAGRIDSPPTIYRGRVYFGSADGHVYCLRISDGQLIWKFRAAPTNQKMLSCGQLEAVWPVHGSVLVRGGVVHCIAGRSIFLDGGLRLLRIDATTGDKISETVLDRHHPDTTKNVQWHMQHKQMAIGLPDVLSSDGEHLYMREQQFYMRGYRTTLKRGGPRDQGGDAMHLFSPTGFLDPSWWHRSYWLYGKSFDEGWGEWFLSGKYVPYGRILTFDNSNVYGYARDPEYMTNSSVFEYRLFSADKNAHKENYDRVKIVSRKDWKTLAKKPDSKLSAIEYNWQVDHPPLLVRAITLADDTLFAAGPPDVMNERKLWGRDRDKIFKKQAKQQEAALNGDKGGILWAVSAKNGKKLAQYRLQSLPVWDGLIAARQRLYVATLAGSIICLETVK